MTNTETYPHAGLSIRKVDDDKFALSIVPDNAGGEVAVPGTNVYLDQPAAAALEHATLDADANANRAGQLILNSTHFEKPCPAASSDSSPE
ncbi:hypothetical protein AB0C12_12880 [Actinoplanes sp. NPDC048967]|uniref:hypothetical protein n=1 Tax=Actinoplanes sp. NPDC048967 TaxID=3155269 RepID=UPI0033F912BA